MKETIFDLIEDKIPEGREGYFKIAENAPAPKNDSFVNSVKDYAKTFLKGSVEGLSRFGKMMGPLQNYEGKTNEQELEQQTEILDELLPTDEKYGQKSFRSGLKQIPSMLGFPGSTIGILPRAMGAGFLGEGAKELNLPEWAQSAAELTAYIGPDITKKLLSAGNNKELIDFAKKMGMSDEQITPLIQSQFKQKWLTRLSPKRGRTEESLKSTKGALDSGYAALQKTEVANKEISEVANGKLINSIKEKLGTMPRDVQTKIEGDLADLLNNKITGSSLMNFWKDINHNASSNKELSLLKGPINKALQSISPELAKDFQMVNSLYTKFFPIASKLKPRLSDDIVSAAETIGMLGGGVLGLLYGNYTTMTIIFGEKIFKKVAQQMLINPRFQQIAKKMNVAFQENKFGLANKLVNDFKELVSKINPKYKEKIPSLTEEEFGKLLETHAIKH